MEYDRVSMGEARAFETQSAHRQTVYRTFFLKIQLLSRENHSSRAQDAWNYT